MAHSLGGAAGAGDGGRVPPARQGRGGGRALAGRIQRAGRRRRASRIADAARLLRLRGEAMQTAVPAGEGAMAALLGAELDAGARRSAPRPRRSPDDDARARGGRAGQRQWRRPGGDLRPSRGGRAGRRDRQGARRAPGDAAAGLRAVPLRADGARPPTRWPRRSERRRPRAPAVPLIANVSAAKATDPGRDRATCWSDR